jgi:hypothetical protein
LSNGYKSTSRDTDSNKCNNADRGRKTNAEWRPREYLEPDEVERMITAARKTKNRTRFGVFVITEVSPGTARARGWQI